MTAIARGCAGFSWAIFRRAIFAMAMLVVCGAVSAPATYGATSDSGVKHTRGLAYVALGDSYAAGNGLEPLTKAPVPGCEQSSSDYPHLVARELGMRLKDMTCTGAVSANLIGTPQKTGTGTAPPQSNALGKDTKVVTITIGGNDIGFFATATACIALSADGPILSDKLPNCRKSFVTEGTDTLAARTAGPLLTGTSSHSSGLTAAFAAVKAAAPHAKVFVIGYPTIMPDAAHTPAAGCYRGTVQGNTLQSVRVTDSFPFTNVDVSYLNSVQSDLDQATQAAAKKAGFSYLSMLDATAGNSACAASADSYIRGITLRLHPDLSVTVGPGALHPNARGAEFLAQSVIPEIRAAFTPKTTVSPAAPDTPTVSPSLAWLGWVAAVVVLLALVFLLVIRARRRQRD